MDDAAYPWGYDPLVEGNAMREVVVIPVRPDGGVGSGWGKAPRVAVAIVEDGAITDWQEHEVDWDRLHDEGGEGAHHARIVRFVREQQATRIVVHHMGAPMQHTLGLLGLTVTLGAAGDARAAILATAPGLEAR